MVFDAWDDTAIHIVTSIYGCTDVVGLIRVPSLPFTTKLHHVTVGTFMVLNWIMDYTKFSVWRGAVIYGAISCTTFLVNFYLGVRLLYPHKHTSIKVLCTIAMFIYAFALLFTWIMVSTYIIIPSVLEYQKDFSKDGISFLNTINLGIFGMFLFNIVRDDIILIKHLNVNSTFRIDEIENVVGSGGTSNSLIWKCFRLVF